jgi:hypothetical protein
MKNTLTFEEVLNPAKFLELQNKFKYHDDRTGRITDFFIEPQVEDFNIIYGVLNPETGENEHSEEFFFNDYLVPRISGLKSDFLKIYQNEVDELKVSNGNVNLFYQQKISEVLLYFEDLDNSEHLNGDLYILLFEQLEISHDLILKLNSKTEQLRGDKINFRESSYDVLVLFYLLRQNEIINWYNFPELKTVIENNCRYFDPKTKTYIDFEIDRKLLYGFKNGDKGIAKAINRLKDKFQSGDFFELK